MTNRAEKFILTLGLTLLALAAAEQEELFSVFFSRATSYTSTMIAAKPAAGDPASTVQIERPLLRWLPFVKYGETVHFHTYQRAGDHSTMTETDATTRTRVLVIGLCSTSQYDKLADASFNDVHRGYALR